jgi:hypothetical protein
MNVLYATHDDICISPSLSLFQIHDQLISNVFNSLWFTKLIFISPSLLLFFPLSFSLFSRFVIIFCYTSCSLPSLSLLLHSLYSHSSHSFSLNAEKNFLEFTRYQTISLKWGERVFFEFVLVGEIGLSFEIRIIYYNIC